MKRLVLPLVVVPLLAGLAACPRPVVGSGRAPPPPIPPPVIIDALRIEPGRSYARDGGSQALFAFAGDDLVVTGSGWNVENAVIRVGDTQLATLTVREAGRLGGELPQGISGPQRITVVSGDRSGESAQTIEVLGSGHLQDRTYVGPIEVQMVISSAGSAALPCRYSAAPVDAGTLAPPERCDVQQSPDGRLTVVFNFGAFQRLDGDHYTATLEFFGGSPMVAKLPPLPGGATGRLVSGVEPYLEWDADGGARARTVVQQVTIQSGEESRISVLVDGEPAIESNDMAALLLRGPRNQFIGIHVGAQPDGTFVHRPELFTRTGPVVELPLPTDGGALPGFPGAAGYVERGWDFFRGAVFDSPELVTLSCDKPGMPTELHLNRVFVEGGQRRTDTLTRALPRFSSDTVECDDECRAILARASGPSLAYCADDPACGRAIDCFADATCLEDLTAFGSCMIDEACRGQLDCVFAGGAACGCDSGDCAAALQCVLRSGEKCVLGVACADIPGHPCRALPACLADSSCRVEVSALADRQRRANVICALEEESCRPDLECALHACAPFPPRRLQPVETATMAVVQPRVGVFGRTSLPLCTLNTYNGRLHNVLPPLRATSLAIAYPSNLEPAGGRVLMIPDVGGELTHQMFVFSLAEDFRRVPTRTTYVSLHPDARFPVVYAVPETGGRVDVLDLDGEFTGSTSVLGTPLDAWPLAGGNVLMVQSNTVIVVDPAGAVVTMPSDFGPVPPWFAVDGAALDVPQALWFAASDGTGERMDLVRLDLTLGGTFGAPVSGGSLANGDFVIPVAAVGGRVLLQVSSSTPPPGCAHLNRQTYTWLGWVTPQANTQLVPAPVDPWLCDAYAVAYNPWTDDVFINVNRTRDDEPGDELPPRGTCRLNAREGGTCPQPLLYPSVWWLAPLPLDGAIGSFSDDSSVSAIKGISPDGTLYDADMDPLPFTLAPVTVSPDGRRLYAGLDGYVAEVALSPGAAPGQVAGRFVGLIPIEGRASKLRVGHDGETLLYIDRDKQLVGRIF